MTIQQFKNYTFFIFMVDGALHITIVPLVQPYDNELVIDDGELSVKLISIFDKQFGYPPDDATLKAIKRPWNTQETIFIAILK